MYNHKEIEENVLEFWKKNKIFEKVRKKNKGGKKFYFLQGPPYTSGKIHIGTAWNNCLKDMIMRFMRLKGFDVWDRGGYDTHGLPIENKVQKDLRLQFKEDIEKYGVAKFTEKCEKFARDGAKTMSKEMQKLGIWMDNDDPYLTLSDEYINGEWFFIKESWNQNRIYRDKKIIHWCADCETGLAKHELEYKNDTDDSIFLRFKIKDKNEYLIIWTTTPWTIPFNLAIMVNPNLDYVKLKTDEGKVYVLAKALANIFMTSVLGEKYKILEEFKGEKLKGVEYVHPFHDELKKIYDELKQKHKNVHTVILSEKYVDTTAGSGLVHCAPGCGPEDKEVGDEYGIPPFNTLNEVGELTGLGKFAKLKAKKDDKKFIEFLKENKSLLETTKVEHEYPHCWRCKNPVVFRATEQWFLKISDLVDKMIKENSKVKWIPEFGKINYDHWTSNLRDNSIVRQRYWGCPFPLWKCDVCGKTEIIGSIRELEKRAKEKIEKLHKPWIDEVKWKCENCKEGVMIRDPDVLDVWIDAGTAGWNCLRYPLVKEDFEKYFPADLVLEATEQVRLWFSMLNICSMIVFKKNSFKACYMHGMVLDWHGAKMSKSLGNIIGPEEVIEKAGADGMRYYMFQNSAGENFNFNWEELKIKQRNLNVLYNISNFILDLKKRVEPDKNLEVEEKYILSRKNSTIEKVTKLMDEFRLDEIIKEIENLFLDVSRIYIKMIRDKSNSEDAGKVLYALEDVYKDILIMFSIVCPFITESLCKETFEEESVHLCDWPKADKKLIDKSLEEEMEIAFKMIELGLAQRDKAQIGLKWPLPFVSVCYFKAITSEVEEIVKNQLNVKKIEVMTGSGEEMKVELETTMTPELEAEGYAREISRNAQAFRKELGLEKKDLIELKIFTDDKFKKILEKQKDFIQERTNSSRIIIELEKNTKETFKNTKDFKIKDKRGKIVIITTTR